MHNPESVIENETHTILWYFEIQTHHLMPARGHDIVVVDKKKKITRRIVEFAVLAEEVVKLNESEREISISTLLENGKSYRKRRRL